MWFKPYSLDFAFVLLPFPTLIPTAATHGLDTSGLVPANHIAIVTCVRVTHADTLLCKNEMLRRWQGGKRTLRGWPVTLETEVAESTGV